jgi:signal transduction histidine kinase
VDPEVEPSSQEWQIGDVCDAALQTLINDRCRGAYLHDMRGGLQAIYSSFELLARCAKKGAVSGALIDNASALAKRAMASHERILLGTVNQLTVPEDESIVINVLQLLEEAQRFLRNDASSRNIHVSVTGSIDVHVSAPLNKLRTLLLGLLTLHIDTLPAGAELPIEVSRVGEEACLSFPGAASFGEIRSAEALFCEQAKLVQSRDLILGGAQHWLQKHAGRMLVHSGASLRNDLQIYFPLCEGVSE